VVICLERGGENVGKWEEASTWIFVQGPRVPSYATVYDQFMIDCSLLCDCIGYGDE